MKKIKIFIIILIVLLLITSIILLIFINKEKGLEQSQADNNTIIALEEQTINKELQRVDLFKLKNCMTKYINTLNKQNPAYFGTNENGEYVKIISEEELKNSIYNLLSESYIRDNNITMDNIYNFVDDINENMMFNILKIKYHENENLNQYVIYGYFQNLRYEFIKYAYYIVNINDVENIFSIEPVREQNDIDKIGVKDTIINNNDNNSISGISINNENICKEYLRDYKNLMLSNPEEAYKFLDEEYRQKRFGDIKRFKDYINTNREQIIGSTLSKYSAQSKDNYTQYICIDQNGNYYIFNENAVMDYTVILDTYTLDLPQFTEKYNNVVDSEKVLLNIQKIFEAINSGDYKYVYNKLDNTFKQNNFSTEESFEEYMKKNFYLKNNVAYGSYKTSGNLHIYELNITDKNDESKPTITKNFIMQLLNGTDFVMSFNV